MKWTPTELEAAIKYLNVTNLVPILSWFFKLTRGIVRDNEVFPRSVYTDEVINHLTPLILEEINKRQPIADYHNMMLSTLDWNNDDLFIRTPRTFTDSYVPRVDDLLATIAVPTGGTVQLYSGPPPPSATWGTATMPTQRTILFTQDGWQTFNEDPPPF